MSATTADDARAVWRLALESPGAAAMRLQLLRRNAKQRGARRTPRHHPHVVDFSITCPADRGRIFAAGCQPRHQVRRACGTTHR